jgi:valyl-tRNA synthetase
VAPLLALGYPKERDLGYHPTDVMETGRDLIFKWIPRMVIFSLYLKGTVPFHTVYLHGMVNDKHGKKMSKSKGNVVSPIELSDKYGADALRIALVVGNTPGSDVALSEDKIKGYKHFCNKIWNASRFVLSNIGDMTLETPRPTLTSRDEEILRASMSILLVLPSILKIIVSILHPKSSTTISGTHLLILL